MKAYTNDLQWTCILYSFSVVYWKCAFCHSLCSNITLKIHVLCPKTPFSESLFSLGSVRDKQPLPLHVPSVPVAKQVPVIIINGSDIYIVHYHIFIFIFNILWHWKQTEDIHGQTDKIVSAAS